MIVHSCTVEWIEPRRCGVARIHEGEAGKLGDPYVWSCTLERSGRLATLRGVCRPLPPGAARVLCDELYRQGMRLRVHERKAGSTGWRRVLKVIQPPKETTACG